MYAAVLKSYAPISSRPLQLEQILLPPPQADEIQVRVKACGICRTDLHLIEGELSPQTLPIIPGHQIVGIVTKLGEDCKHFKLGDRVGIAWLRSTCSNCNYCISNKENLCESSRYTGYHEHGGYAEFANVREDYAYLIPSVFSDAEATPLLCAGIIGFRALKRANLPQGGKLALFGFGSSAHLSIQIAKSRGCEVYVATRGLAHREFARQLGADWVGDTYEKLPSLVDSAIIFAPIGNIIPAALRSIRKGGTVISAGIHMSTVPTMDYESCLFHEKDLRSVEANTRIDGEEFLAEAAAIPIRPKVTLFSLNQINEALIKLKSDAIDGSGVIVID